MKSVFLSSTWKDLALHRSKVKDALDLAGYNVIRMERFPSDPRPPLETCLAHLDTADICVLIIGQRYGSSPPNRKKSFTEREYDHCRRKGIPVIPFFMGADHSNLGEACDTIDGTIKLENFRKRVAQNHTPAHFNSPDELATKVAIAVESELRNLVSSSPAVPINEQAISISDAIKAASAPLLSWPQTLANGNWIERPELLSLQEELKTDGASSVTLLLGPPGSGKSAILSRLSEVAAKTGIHVLGIKAEFLSSSISSLEDLSAELLLPLRIDKCIELCGRERPTLLVIDQLDAICELSDLRTGRLNVILNLINRCRHLQGVKIVASCRDFDFNYDARVCNLDAKRIDLSLPAWGRVNEELSAVGIEAANEWPGPCKEILRTPEFLRQFLLRTWSTDEVAVFQTYQALLDDIWNRRINTTEKRAMVSALTLHLMESEEQWAPAVRFDEFQNVSQQLQSEGVLTRINTKIGFCHQTMLEHAKARYFTAHDGALAAHVLQRQDALFVRPTIWSTLTYLREADIARYRRELGVLFASELRLHVAFLLIDFLGRQPDPFDFEIELLAQQLQHPANRRRVLIAIIGQKKWYEAYRGTHFPTTMHWPLEELWPMIPLLSRALEFSRDDCLTFIDRYLIPDPSKDELTRQVFHNFSNWDEESVRRICILIRRAPPGYIWWAEGFSNQISEITPALAPNVVAEALQRQVLNLVVPNQLNRDEQNKDAGKNIVEISNSWHELAAVAELAPVEFLEKIWPIFVRNAENEFGGHSASSLNCYPGFFRELEPREEPPGFSNVATALRTAVLKCAEISPLNFHRITKDSWSVQRHPVQQLLAEGLTVAATAIPEVGLEFICSDSRRLFLHNHGLGRASDHFYSAPLVTALASQLDPAKLKTLENSILVWSMYRTDVILSDDQKEGDAESLRQLLLAIPPEYRSPEVHSIVGDEPTPVIPLRRYRGGLVKEIPLLPLENAQSSSDEIVLDALRNSAPVDEIPTDWSDETPGGVRRGSYRAQIDVIGSVCEEDPDRALELLPKLYEAGYEDAMSAALKKLEKSSLTDAQLFQLIERITSSGARSEQFRADASYLLYRRCKEHAGLPDSICHLLLDWLVGPWEIDRDFQRESKNGNDHVKSVLWGYNDIRTLGTDQSFWTLVAITNGYLMRIPPATDQWLDVVEAHSSRNHDERTWEHYCSEMRFISLESCDKARGINIVAKLFDKYPAVLASESGVILIANISHYVDPDLLQDWLIRLRQSEWETGLQAFGELLALFVARNEERYSWTHEVFEELLASHLQSGSDEDAVVGIALTAANLWGEPEARDWAGKVLLRLIPGSAERIALGISTVFWADDGFPADTTTENLLRAVASNPKVLVGNSVFYLVPHLTSLLPHCRRSIQEVCLAMLNKDGAEILQSDLYSTGPDLVNIALTLQRFDDTRSGGLDLFETLLRLGLDEAFKCLNEIDLRPISTRRREPLSRRQRKSDSK